MMNEKTYDQSMMSKFLGGMKAKLLRSLVAMFGDNEAADVKVAAAPAEAAVATVVAETPEPTVVAETPKSPVVAEAAAAAAKLAGWKRQVSAQPRPAVKPKARPVVKSHGNTTKLQATLAPKFRVRPATGAKVSAKPAYHALPKGTTVLVDTANLVGTIEPGDLAHKLNSFADSLKSFGYSVQYVWERRSYAWARAIQTSSADKVSLDAFVKSSDVTLVNGESDMTLLQLAGQIPGSVIMTRDRLRDYREEYPELVGSRRHLSFSCVKRDGELLLTIDGFHDAVAIPPRPQEVFIEPELEWIEPMVDEEPVVVDAARRPRGMEAVAGNCLRRGDAKRALGIYGRLAKKDPSKYREMADIFAEGKGVPQDRKAARKFEELARSRAKMFRSRARRQRRLQAEVYRARFSSRLRLSAAA